MDYYHYCLFLLFTVIALMIIIDPNVGVFITLLVKLMSIKLQEIIWKIKYHPKNPITNYLRYLESFRIAKELRRQIDEDQDKVV